MRKRIAEADHLSRLRLETALTLRGHGVTAAENEKQAQEARALTSAPRPTLP